ncbi:MAG: hypothetical protein KME23_22600 [Goleter apudmare HA4340-LM2]|nr:hypothetical protein [Goleter apudmare HA4340-LM2]
MISCLGLPINRLPPKAILNRKRSHRNLYERGDAIAFYMNNSPNTKIETHRVVILMTNN